MEGAEVGGMDPVDGSRGGREGGGRGTDPGEGTRERGVRWEGRRGVDAAPSARGLLGALVVWASARRVAAQEGGFWEGVQVLDSARCDLPGDEGAMAGYVDACGVCGGDGATCGAAAVVLLVLFVIFLFGLSVVWCKFFHDQIRYDKHVKRAERLAEEDE